MYADLIARTCGFLGVLTSLIVMGFVDRTDFIVTPQQSFSALEVQISMMQNDNKQQSNTSTPPKEAQEQVEKLEKESEFEQEEAIEPIAPQEQVKVPVKEQMSNVQEVKQKVEKTKVTPPKPQNKPIEKEKEVKVQNPHKTKQNQSKNTEEKAKAQSQNKNKTSTEQKAKVNKVEQNNKAKLDQEQSMANAYAQSQQLNQELKAQISSLLVQAIKSKLKYPRNAVRRKLEGTVMVEFTISQGVVTSYTITKSSGHKILDEAARKLADSMVQFNTQVSNTSNRVLIPIKYELI